MSADVRQLVSGASAEGDSSDESNSHSSFSSSSTSRSSPEHGKIRPLKRGMKLIQRSWQVLAAIAVGVLFLRYTENFSVVNAFYVITQMVTTIGYGDIIVQNEWGRLFMAFYALWILVLLAFYLNTVVAKVLSEQEEKMKAKLRDWERQLHKRFCKGSSVGEIKDEDVQAVYGKYNSLLFSSMIFAGHLLFGTVLFAKLEGQSIISSFYASVITLTTIGFGDVSPRTDVGKVVSIFWMLSGIVSAADFVKNLQVVFFNFDAERRFNAEAIDCEEMFSSMDMNNDGTLSQGEFIQYCLLKQRLVDPKILKRIVAVYDRIDSDDNNQLTMEEMLTFKSEVLSRRVQRQSTLKRCSVM